MTTCHQCHVRKVKLAADRAEFKRAARLAAKYPDREKYRASVAEYRHRMEKSEQQLDEHEAECTFIPQAPVPKSVGPARPKSDEPRRDLTTCPACRNTTSLTSTGYLRKHPDLFGGPCTNKDAGQRSWRSLAEFGLTKEGA